LNKREIRGILPALLTPFTQDGKVDEEKLGNLIDFLADKVHGVWACGSYGSGPLMSEADRRIAAEVVVKRAAGRITTIIHVGTADTSSTVSLARHAEQIGADAVASITPYYYTHLDETILVHYQSLIESVDIPVFLYNNPKCSNFSVSPKLLEQLASIGLGGVKDSSGTISLFYNYIDSVTTPGFIFLIGSQTNLLPAMVGGGHGCVSGLSNLFPEFIVRIYNLCTDRDFERARKLQRIANRLRSLTGPGIPIPFYHVAMRFRGIDIGVPKLPFLMPPEEEQERIKGLLEEYSILDGVLR
jgi:4-hydroxy-tetrahydrodipicolinate synthase